MENSDKSQGCRKLSRIHKLPLMIYPKLQPYSKVIKRTKKQEETDASEHAIGGVLSQKQDRKWKPIAFLSRTM